MEAPKKKPQQEERQETLVRILGYDIPGSKSVFVGLTKIKGVSWAVSNMLCKKLNIAATTKIYQLDKKMVTEIENKLRNLELYDYMKNRRKDFDSGESVHLLGTELDIRKEFDIKRLKQIKSYRGVRHMLRQPVRGQRTRSHFRTTGITVGVKKKSK